MEDLLTKDGATRLAARLSRIYGSRVTFRVEQDLYGLWAVRSDMVRGCPKDGVPFLAPIPPGMDKTRRSTKKLNPEDIEEI